MTCSGTFAGRGQGRLRAPWLPRFVTWTVMCLPWMAAQPVQAQSLTNTGSLTFGSFTTTGAGTVTVTPAGSRTGSGLAWLLQSGSGGTGAAFTLRADPNTVFAITFSAHGSALLSDGAGHSMALQAFTHDAGITPITSQNGTAQFNVGATLSIGQSLPRGAYSGTFSVTVNYQ